MRIICRAQPPVLPLCGFFNGARFSCSLCTASSRSSALSLMSAVFLRSLPTFDSTGGSFLPHSNLLWLVARFGFQLLCGHECAGIQDVNILHPVIPSVPAEFRRLCPDSVRTSSLSGPFCSRASGQHLFRGGRVSPCSGIQGVDFVRSCYPARARRFCGFFLTCTCPHYLFVRTFCNHASDQPPF